MQAQSTLGTAEESVAIRKGPAFRHPIPLGRFALQFMEMCAAMCAGGIALDVIFFQGIALLGYANFFEQNRELSILVLGVNWAIAMGAWMAIRGHPWRHNLEMSSTSIIAALLLVLAYWWFGFAPATRLPGWFGQMAFQCGPSCSLMGAYMLFRYKHYTTGHVEMSA